MFQPRGNDRREKSAVVDARSEPVQRLAMFRHGVALVVFEAVARAIQRQRAHQAVARHLGDDRGGGDRHHDAVAADHRIAVAGRVDLVAAVDEHMLRHLGQCTDRARQRPERGAQDIVAIDPRRRGKGDRKGRCRADLLEQFLAALGRQPLGIVDALGNSLRVQHDGGRHHRARQRTAPGLVAAGHRPDAALDQRPLAAKARRRDRDHALGRLGLFLAGLLVGFLADFLPGSVLETRKPATGAGTTHAAVPRNPANPAGEPAGLRRLDAGRDHDFPGMVVGIAEIAGVTAVIGLVRRLQ